MQAGRGGGDPPRASANATGHTLRTTVRLENLGRGYADGSFTEQDKKREKEEKQIAR